MFFDLSEPGHPPSLRYDVGIIGAGPAGLALASSLNDGRTRICLLESGGRAVENRFQALNESECVGLQYDSEGSRCRAFGGTTHWWAGACTPPDPVDFAVRGWAPAGDWPFPAEELRPFYQPALELLGLESFEIFDFEKLPAAWRRARDPVDLEQAGLQPKLFQYSAPPANLGAALSGLVECSECVDCYLNATATEIVAGNDGSTAERVLARSLAGAVVDLRAKVFVICAGGLESARLLLLSDSVHAAGLGNGHDQVGRYLMDHLRSRTAPVPLRRAVRVPPVYAGVAIRNGLLRAGFTLRASVQREEEMLNSNLMLFWNPLGPTEPDLLAPGAGMAAVLRRPDVLARLAWERLRRQRSFRQLALCTNHEQSANPSSRVTLGEQRDGLGCRKLRIDWRLQDLDERSIERFHERVRTALARLDLLQGPLEFRGLDEDRTFDASSHPMGTTRMSNDPRRGVVDADCCVHSIANLYVCGSSVFPRGGNANPALTIVALAMRLAGHLRRRMR